MKEIRIRVKVNMNENSESKMCVEQKEGWERMNVKDRSKEGNEITEVDT